MSELLEADLDSYTCRGWEQLRGLSSQFLQAFLMGPASGAHDGKRLCRAALEVYGAVVCNAAAERALEEVQPTDMEILAICVERSGMIFGNPDGGVTIPHSAETVGNWPTELVIRDLRARLLLTLADVLTQVDLDEFLAEPAACDICGDELKRPPTYSGMCQNCAEGNVFVEDEKAPFLSAAELGKIISGE